MQHTMEQWPVSEEIIVVATMVGVPMIMLAIALLLGSTGLMLLAITVGPAIGWPIGVMLMGVIDRKTHPLEHEKDPY
ncbi:MAG: hypothetical protein ACPG4Q_01930 [Phycisphaeraceae bacterium]